MVLLLAAYILEAFKWNIKLFDPDLPFLSWHFISLTAVLNKSNKQRNVWGRFQTQEIKSVCLNLHCISRYLTLISTDHIPLVYPHSIPSISPLIREQALFQPDPGSWNEFLPPFQWVSFVTWNKGFNCEKKAFNIDRQLLAIHTNFFPCAWAYSPGSQVSEVTFLWEESIPSLVTFCRYLVTFIIYLCIRRKVRFLSLREGVKASLMPFGVQKVDWAPTLLVLIPVIPNPEDPLLGLDGFLDPTHTFSGFLKIWVIKLISKLHLSFLCLPSHTHCKTIQHG